MLRNIALIAVLYLTLSMLTASEPVSTQSGLLTILPEDCRMLAREEIVLELSGFLSSDAVVTWDIDRGEVISLLPGSSAVLIAPTGPSVITVYATITGNKPDRWIYLNRQCIVYQLDITDG